MQQQGAPRCSFEKTDYKALLESSNRALNYASIGTNQYTTAKTFTRQHPIYSDTVKPINKVTENKHETRIFRDGL